MRRKTLSSIRLVAVCLVIISIITFTVSAVSTGLVKREYKAAQKNCEETEKSVSQSIDDNNKEISKKDEELNSVKKEVSSKNSVVDKLNNDLIKLSDSEEGKVCYLTFDDGPSEHTTKILQVLKEKDAKATFFVTGVGSTKYMKNIVDSGNAIALHTYSHDYSKIYKSTDAYFEDLTRIHDLVEKQTGVDARVIRFPGGSSNLVSKKYCVGIMSKLTDMVENKGYAYFDWNVDSTDASGNNISADTIANNVINGAKANRINVLMHDTDAKKTTLDALPKIIDGLRAKGYSFDVLTSETSGFHHSVNN